MKVGVRVDGTNGVFVWVKVALGVKLGVGLALGLDSAWLGVAEGLALGVTRPGARRTAISPAQ